jgi:hypothetical protein
MLAAVRRAPEVFSINAEELAAELGDRAANQGPGRPVGDYKALGCTSKQQHQQRVLAGRQKPSACRTSNLAGEWLLTPAPHT